MTDPDLAFAIRLQQEELQRIASRRDTAYGAYGQRASFGGGVAPPGTPSRSASQRSAAANASGGGWASLTTLLLVFVTACWIALFIVSLADNGWNLEDLGLNPWAGASQSALLAVGAQQAQLVTGAEWWRLLSSAFVNAGVIQVGADVACVVWSLHWQARCGVLQPAACAACYATLPRATWPGVLLPSPTLIPSPLPRPSSLASCCSTCRACGRLGGTSRPRACPAPLSAWLPSLCWAAG